MFYWKYALFFCSFLCVCVSAFDEENLQTFIGCFGHTEEVKLLWLWHIFPNWKLRWIIHYPFPISSCCIVGKEKCQSAKSSRHCYYVWIRVPWDVLVIVPVTLWAPGYLLIRYLPSTWMIQKLQLSLNERTPSVSHWCWCQIVKMNRVKFLVVLLKV